MRTKLFLILILTAVIGISCNSKKASTEENGEHEVLPANIVEMNEAQYKTAGIELGAIEQKALSSELKVNGLVNVSPQNLVSISAIMGGYVKSTTLVQGSPVAKGQVVAVIENTAFIELQQNYLESKSKLDYAEKEYFRQKELNKENVNSAKTLQMAAAEYQSLQSTVFALQQKLKMIGIEAKRLQVENISGSLTITSPISGYVKAVNVNVGKYVNPTDVMFEIVNTQNLTLELSLFEKDIAKVSIGQKISFSIPNAPGSVQTAVVYQVGKALNTDKTIKVYATIGNENKNLLPGMFVNASIKVQNDSLPALPDEAVLSFEDKNYIFVFAEKKKEGDKMVNWFKIVEVQKGVSTNGYSHVILPKDFDLKTLNIVIKGAYNLLSAMKNAGDMAC